MAKPRKGRNVGGTYFTQGQLRLLRFLGSSRSGSTKVIVEMAGMSYTATQETVHRMYENLGWKERSIRLLTIFAIINADELGIGDEWRAGFQ